MAKSNASSKEGRAPAVVEAEQARCGALSVGPMNAGRVAAALRLLADAIEDEGESPPVVERFPKPGLKKARQRRVRTIDAPPVVDDVTARRAEMALRRAGIYKVKP